MLKSIPLAALAALTLAGCATQAPFLDSKQPTAMQTALKRGQFELNCPAAKEVLLSREVLQPILFNGIQRAEYTIGVDGCGQRTTFIVICPDESDGCYAAGPGGFVRGR